MDDTCAVCAETLEWVSYGTCGHREVCSTCVARLRFICEDHRCCLCKSESNIIFVTKVRDYTRTIKDFSAFPADPKEGRVGSYWYHEDTQAYFDDLDHYKMIKAMCRLSCCVCDRMDEQGNEGSKRKGRFRSIEQLKGHLFHQHRLFMCSLCLEGRKIFVCEQKLYTRTQLNQHIKTGDSEVDGSESERGGFAGHPMCEFCRNPFYGDNELYMHMSTEHYTCHICQRQHPGHYEYYKNYDDLEIHFRGGHFLCEDECCLAKKFVVFATESEMKRHNTMEHGGRMSRSRRNAALQIPTSFQFRRRNERDLNGRERDFFSDSTNDQLYLAIQSSLETANADAFNDTVSSAQAISNLRGTREVDSILQSFESLACMDSELSSRSTQGMRQNSQNTPLEISSFPPLPSAPSNSKRKTKKKKVLGRNAMAACPHPQSNGTINGFNSSQAWPLVRHQPMSSGSVSSHSRPISNSGPALSSSSVSSSLGKPATVNGLVHCSYASPAQATQASVNGLASSISASSSKNSSSRSKVQHSNLAPNLADGGSFHSSTSDFPPVSAAQTKNQLPMSTQPLLKAEDVHVANKSLTKRIHAALEFDKDKYSAFKIISVEYRQGLIGTGEYLAYVHQFGLSHLILELAKLCPDVQKQKELLEAYNANLGNGPCDGSVGNDSVKLKSKKSSKKGKEKCEENGTSDLRVTLADSIINTVRRFQSSNMPSEKVEVLSKDGYRSAKGKGKILVSDEPAVPDSAIQPLTESRSVTDSESADGCLKKNLGIGGAGHKQRKKTSKFHRNRLGDGSPGATLDVNNVIPAPAEEKSAEITSSYDRLPVSLNGRPVHGAWRNQGGQRLVAITLRK
ncbi:uncharacterized protein LOC131154393 isoform X2 [Malania oleifera]|uniref:uncharacterized protein LOC131154393 isoform X2 n=1 Tax=Malania oleifera TaxID=397392 RepID=UPI0025AE0738|nr:uncharacterized protein LOC131154393 isoform X2 [Malania oleifera]